MLRNVGLRKSVEQPVLDLNFAASQIGANAAPDSRIDFSRGSNAYFVDSDGLVKKSPHNLATRSEEIGSWTTLFAVTISSNAGLSPTGELTADKIIADNGATSAGATRNVGGLDDSVDVSVSVYLKAVEASNFKIFFYNKANTFHNSGEFDLTDGSRVSASSSNTQSTIEHVGNGWYRVTMTGMNTATGGTTPNFRIITASMTNFSAGDGSSGILAWGAQLSQHSTLPVGNPYIRTDSSAVYAARLDHDPTWFMSAAQEQNLLRYSEMLDNSAWSKLNVTVTADATTDPLGGTTAERVENGTNTGTHVVFATTNNELQVTSGTTYTLSAYVKADELFKIRLQFSTTYFPSQTADFDLSAESVATTGSVSASITDSGNGWYRCAITVTADGTGQNNANLWLLNAAGQLSYTGANNGLFIWGAQLEVGSTAGTYHRTEGQPYYGEGATPKGLLIEEARTNIAPNSDDFAVGNEVTRSADAHLAPDGTITADEFTITTANQSHQFVGESLTGSLVTVGTVHAVSFFAKLISGTPNLGVRGFGKGGFNQHPIFDLSNGTVVNVGSAWESGTSIEDFGNGWFRCKCVVNPSAQFNLIIHMLESGDTTGVLSFAGNGTDKVAVWGVQLEVGSFVTSHIATTGSTATRNADVATMGPTTGGTELVSDPGFDSGVGQWVATGNATVSHDASNLNVEVAAAAATGTNLARYSVSADGATIVEGRRYRLSFDVTRDAGACNYFFKVHDDNSFTTELGLSSTASGSSASLFVDCTANSSGELLISFIRSGTLSSSDAFSLDNLSVRELYPFEQYNPSEGTYYIHSKRSTDVNSRFYILNPIADGVSPNEQMYLWHWEGSATTVRWKMDSGGSSSTDKTRTTTLDADMRLAAPYKSNSAALALNGSASFSTDTSVTVPPIDKIGFGYAGLENARFLNGHIKEVSYYARRLSNETLEALTDD